MAPLWSESFVPVDVHSARSGVRQVERVLLTSRLAYSTDTLTQQWRDLPDVQLPGWQLGSAALVTVENTQIIVVDCTIDFQDDSIADLEEYLTTGAQRIIESFSTAPGRPMWVSRTCIADECPPEWIMPNDRSGSLDEGGIHAVFSWGNNYVRTDLDLADEQWRAFVRGMVDAQVLWCRLDAILRASGSEIRRISDGGPSEHRVSLSKVAGIERALMAHDLSLDEFETQIQGIRKHAAEIQLSAWRFEDMRQRAPRRVKDLATVARQESERRRARYQGVVEMILFVLGLTALLQTVLSFIQTAFSGGVSAVPGGDRGFLQWVRASNLDLVLGLVTVLLVAVLWIVLILRRRVLR